MQHKTCDYYNISTNKFTPLEYFAETNLLPNVKLDDSPARKIGSLKGKVAPDWTLPLLKSTESLTLSQLKGKIVLFEFTATWCLPCRFAVEMMEKLQSKYANNKKIVLVSAYLDARENEENILKMVKTQNQHSIALHSAQQVWEQYKQYSVPVFYIIDDKGKIVEQFNGYSDQLQSKIEDKIDKMSK
jgi:thiol-disulfide isomerase/thioredoxin